MNKYGHAYYYNTEYEEEKKMDKWIIGYPPVAFVHCNQCQKKTWHERGHMEGWISTKLICLRCYTKRNITDDDIKDL